MADDTNKVPSVDTSNTPTVPATVPPVAPPVDTTPDFDKMSTAELAKLAKTLLKDKQAANKEAKKTKEALQARENADKLAAEEAAKARGEWERLHNEKDSKLTVVSARLQLLEESLNATFETQIGTLTEEQKQQFNSLFGDITDSALKLKKLAAWTALLPKNPLANGINGGVPASQVTSPNKIQDEYFAEIKAAQKAGDTNKVRMLRNEMSEIYRQSVK